MPTLTVNGVSFAYPATGGSNWGDAATNWASAITVGTLQKAGGSFALTADVNFGSSYGLLSKYFTSNTASPASTGILRLASTDTIAWRNNANSADIALAKNTTDQLTYAGAAFLSSSGVILPGGFPALTGDVTTSSGSVVTTVAAIDGTTVSGTTGTGNVVFSNSPTVQNLAVYGSGSVVQAQLYSNDSFGGTFLQTNTDHPLFFATNGNPLSYPTMRIGVGSVPNVSIGTNDVHGTMYLFDQATGGSTALVLRAGPYQLTSTSNMLQFFNNANTLLSGFTREGKMFFRTDALSPFQIVDQTAGYTSEVSRLAIDTNGYVGLSTASPSCTLDVNGAGRIRGLTTAGLVVTDASGNLTSSTTVSSGQTFTGSNAFYDNGFSIVNHSDTSKVVLLSLGGMTTGKTLTVASGQTTNQTLTIPNISGSDTLATLGLAQTFTAVLTFSAQPIMSTLTASQAVFTDGSKGLVSNAVTGTGSVVMSNSATLVTPALGTPSALVGTNISGTAANLTAGHVTTNANMTGPITGTGNTTSITAQTGTGTTFVMDTSPTLVTPNLGTPSALVGTNISGTAASLTAGHVTTNANLTGPITSSGNATSIAAQTGTGTTFAMSASPTFTGTVGAAAIAATGTISTTTVGAGAQIQAIAPASQNAVIQASANAGSTVMSMFASQALGTGILRTEGSYSLVLQSNNTQALIIDANQNVAIGSGALATTATNGFFYTNTCSGTPTGTPTSISGRVPMLYDTSANKLWVYNGAWKGILLV